MASNEPDRPTEFGPAVTPAGPSGAEPPAGRARPGPAGAGSLWADMLLSGPGDADEPEPPGSAPPPGYGSLHEGALDWPSSGLPPSFGQRPAAGERPAFGDTGLPPQGSPYGGFRALGPPHPVVQPADAAEPGLQVPPAPDVPQPRGWAAPYGTLGPWETYEAEPAPGWAVGYGVLEDQDTSYGSVAEDDPAGDGAPYRGYGSVPPAEAPPRYPDQAAWRAESADRRTADVLLPGRHGAPPPGWRHALHRVTGGLMRAPQSAAERRRMDLALRARTPVAGGHHRVAVLSLKGGVGKTTTTVGLGATLASLRGDRVIAIDANPDRGTLCDKLRLETAATVRDLLNEGGQIRRYADMRAYTTQAPSGLEVLASDRDPTVSVAFSAEDYEDVAQVLEHYYSVCVTDSGTGLLHSAMAGVLRLADQIVLVSSPSVDGARSASATLDWLAAHQYGDLVRGAVVVLSAIRPRSKSTVDLGRLQRHFAARCRAVVRIPYDAHLEEGAEMDLARLSRATADAYLVLAAEVGDGFAWLRR